MQSAGGYGVGVKVRKLLLHETGSYNPQYRRPYDTHLGPNTINMMLERLGNTRKYEPSQMGGLAGSFITPTATPEKQLTLINGWNERRMKFMMEIEYSYYTGGSMLEVVLGYTDYNGVSMMGSIDPNMRFYINSIMEVRNTVSYGNTGGQLMSSVIGSSHIIVDNNWTSIYAPERDQNMRPTDVYTAMTRIQMHGIPQDGITDARTLVNNNAIKSRRCNASSAEYVSRIFDGYTQAAIQTPYGGGERDLIDTARGLAKEEIASEDPFLDAMMQIRGDGCVGNTFTFKDLRLLDQNIDNVTIAHLLSPETKARTHQTGMTADWGGSDIYTSTASILSQTIPGLMMDLALTRIVFMSTNRDITGAIRTAIMDAQGFSSGDITRSIEIFISKIQNEVLQDISFSGGVDFAITMNVDLLGETWLNLSLDGKAPVDYVTPSFCDALLTPIISSDNNRVMNLASDFQMLSETLLDNNTMMRQNGHSKYSSYASGYTPGLI